MARAFRWKMKIEMHGPVGLAEKDAKVKKHFANFSPGPPARDPVLRGDHTKPGARPLCAVFVQFMDCGTSVPLYSARLVSRAGGRRVGPEKSGAESPHSTPEGRSPQCLPRIRAGLPLR